MRPHRRVLLTFYAEIVIVDTTQDTNMYKGERPDMSGGDSIDVGCCGGPAEKVSVKCLTQPCLADYDLNEWIGESLAVPETWLLFLTRRLIGSYKIFALKM
jgi:hypothetical protein